MLCRALCFAALVATASADCYMHNPRGSNNRLNEKSANRNNGNRLFDSQNNNRGGYNVGDLKNTAFDENSNADQTGAVFTGAFDKDQYSEMFYEGSELTMEWTNQHGCGGNEADDTHKLNCNMVIQYTCNTDSTTEAGKDPALRVEIKNGRNTNTPDAADTLAELATQETTNDGNRRGRHESEGWYFECQRRNRNKGLFLADQKLKGNAAQYTRQNPNGNRRGLECPEERDYYPYWSPSPWVDIAYLTSNVEDCNGKANRAFDVKANSMNVKKVGKCTYGTTTVDAEAKAMLAPITAAECLEAKGTWKEFSHDVLAPACAQADWSRANHLGNGRFGQPLSYNWTLPKVEKSLTGLSKYTSIVNGVAKCIARIRYNISTDDYDVRNITSDMNQNVAEGVISPVTNNPTVDVGADTMQGLRLAINTNQFGRTFQDRSHAFYIKKFPAGLPKGAKMYNLNVRGKRGNIVQTFPSVEYDFMPNQLHVNADDLIHVQWTGSNTHNNGNPAGDGQAGDAGEGTGGTDRHNIACLRDAASNFPIPLDTKDTDLASKCLLLDNANCWAPTDKAAVGTGATVGGAAMSTLAWQDCAMYLGTSGYFKSVAEANANTGDDLNVLLNNAPASLDGGVVISAKKVGEFHYMATRNNNFSNRSQKGVLVVHEKGMPLPKPRGTVDITKQSVHIAQQ